MVTNCTQVQMLNSMTPPPANYVKVTNGGAFVGSFILDFDLDGEHFSLQSPSILVLQHFILYIPKRAINIQIKTYLLSGDAQTLVQIGTKYSPTATKICLTLRGTIFGGYTTEEPCSNVLASPCCPNTCCTNIDCTNMNPSCGNNLSSCYSMSSC